MSSIFLDSVLNCFFILSSFRVSIVILPFGTLYIFYQNLYYKSMVLIIILLFWICILKNGGILILTLDFRSALWYTVFSNYK